MKWSYSKVLWTYSKTDKLIMYYVVRANSTVLNIKNDDARLYPFLALIGYKQGEFK